MNKNLLNRLESEVLILDGAMGTMFQLRGMKPGACPEELNLSDPGLVKEVHGEYVRAGVDIILANTFCGNRGKLGEYGLDKKVHEINFKGVKIAREAADGRCFVGGSIGPLGSFIEPHGDMTFDEAYDIYKEQISACVDGGADFLAFETFSDIMAIKAAIIAAGDVTDIPKFAMMTFQDDLRTVTGVEPESACVTLESLGADVVGVNCGLGPEGLLEIAKRMGKVSGKMLVFQPNAGLPQLKGNETFYPATPRNISEYAKRFVREGVNVFGGCCGTTPDHMKAIVREIKGLKPIKRRPPRVTLISSTRKVVSIGGESLPVKIGERINPTGKKRLSAELKEGKTLLIRDEAVSQVEEGADILDINVGCPGIDEAEMMRKAVLTVQRVADIPIMIDSNNYKALEAGLKAANGKVIINSVSGEKKSLDAVLPLAKRYGAAILGLTLDEKGIPGTGEDRYEIAERILKEAKGYGIPEEDIIIDCLTLTISAKQDQALETLKCIRMIKEKLGISTVLGVSNISFGLPNRSLLNSAFLSMALGAGLDAAIINTSDTRVIRLCNASAVLINKDKRGERYIERHAIGVQELESEGVNSSTPQLNNSYKDRLFQGILEGDKENILTLVEEALKSGLKPMEISDNVLIPALTEVGDRFDKKRLFLPQMILSAETMEKAFTRIKKELKEENLSYAGKVVMATVEGDIHDIGKNIVITLIKNHGFEVIDLGKGISAVEIVQQALDLGADMVGLSALMTTTMLEMEKVVKGFEGIKKRPYIMIGGAVVTQKYADEIGADAYAKDAMEAVVKTKKLLKC
ncbi:MAG: homocysteine S-methyltransferase family protein [Nitrospinota bacterium]